MKRVIETELDFAVTFCKIALESDIEEKIAKHRARARKAYDTALQFLATESLEPNEKIELTKKLASLKSELEELGEKF